jgi:sec-independent protein translocase protein TatC
LAIPFILYQLWTFISPALYENEKRTVKVAFAFAGVLFLLGLVVGYYLIFPLTLRFLGTYQVSSEVVNQISLQSYISMFTWMIMIMGIVFEMPSLAAILSKLGILTRSFLKKYRKHAFVILLVLAAFITPSGDPFTLMAVGLPLYGLYELSILVCRDINK